VKLTSNKLINLIAKLRGWNAYIVDVLVVAIHVGNDTRKQFRDTRVKSF